MTGLKKQKNIYDYPFTALETGALQNIAEGVSWLRSPMPFNLDHINLWLVDTGIGHALFDTGLPCQEAKDVWEKLFENELKERPVTQLNITHFHPDHIGFSAWLCNRFNLIPSITKGEWETAQYLCGDGSDKLTDMYDGFYYQAGCDEEFRIYMGTRRGVYKKRVREIPANYNRIQDKDTLKTGTLSWRVLVGGGHSPEHTCFYAPGSDLFISGDLVLPTITPNVSVWANAPHDNPLKTYLDSLSYFQSDVPDSVLVLPSHGLPFYGLHERCGGIAAHHDDRFNASLERCKTPTTAMEAARALFRVNLNHENLVFAIGEAIAHLNYLVEDGALTRYENDNGIYLYEAV